jgi:hypothetical protein
VYREPPPTPINAICTGTSGVRFAMAHSTRSGPTPSASLSALATGGFLTQRRPVMPSARLQGLTRPGMGLRKLLTHGGDSVIGCTRRLAVFCVGREH